MSGETTGLEIRESQPKAKVFISYARADLSFADHLAEVLTAGGFETLIDRSEIYAFEDWWQRIETLIVRADAVVFVLSPESAASEVCAKEIAFAASLNKRLAPIVVRRVDDRAVPEALRRLNYIFFDDAAQFDARLVHLADALSTDIGWVRKHTEFGEAARRWSAAGRPGPRGLLLRSPILEEAERWIASHPRGAPEPTPTTRTFIADSRRAAKQRRVKAVASVLGITLIVGLGATTWFESEFLKQRWDLWRNVLSENAERSLRSKQEFQECRQCPEMVVVPAGEFMMGSLETERGRTYGEYQQRKVTISKPFAVSKFEVTFDQWDTCVAYGGCSTRPRDEGWGRANRPVIGINWQEAKEYVNWLSKLTGKPYRLLTEAEWEYGARAGSTTAYSWGDDIGKDNANCRGCGSQWDGKQTAPVGSFAANAFGLYDMHGNAIEWVEDCYSDEGAPTDGSAANVDSCKLGLVNRDMRGGAWDTEPNTLRSAFRGHQFINDRAIIFGMRVARALLTP